MRTIEALILKIEIRYLRIDLAFIILIGLAMGFNTVYLYVYSRQWIDLQSKYSTLQESNNGDIPMDELIELDNAIQAVDRKEKKHTQYYIYCLGLGFWFLYLNANWQISCMARLAKRKPVT